MRGYGRSGGDDEKRDAVFRMTIASCVRVTITSRVTIASCVSVTIASRGALNVNDMLEASCLMRATSSCPCSPYAAPIHELSCRAERMRVHFLAAMSFCCRRV